MKLLAMGTISPQGSSLEEHISNKEKVLDVSFHECLLKEKKRKVAVHRACPSKFKLPVPDAVLRRMGLSTQLALSAVEDAKQRLDIDLNQKKVGLIVGTTQGPSSTNIDYFRKLVSFQYRGASPNLFAQSVHNNIASSIALTYQWKGPSLTLVQEDGLWSSIINVAELWLEEKSADYVWIVIGNEMSLHIPYIQLYEHLENSPDAESFIPVKSQISYEAFTAFLITRGQAEDGFVFNIENTQKILTAAAAKKDMSVVKPEHIGVSLCEGLYGVV